MWRDSRIPSQVLSEAKDQVPADTSFVRDYSIVRSSKAQRPDIGPQQLLMCRLNRDPSLTLRMTGGCSG
jgi:hypothetical protein